MVLPRSSFETPPTLQRSPTPIRASGLIIRHCSQTCSGPIRHTTTFAASTQDGFPSVPPHFLLDPTFQRWGGAFSKHQSPYTLLFPRESCHPSLTGAVSVILPSSPVTPRGASLPLKSGHLGRTYVYFQGVLIRSMDDTRINFLAHPTTISGKRFLGAAWGVRWLGPNDNLCRSWGSLLFSLLVRR